MKKVITGIVLVLFMGIWSSPASAASDLPASHGFYDEITYLMEQEILGGYPDGTVRPNVIVSRAEAAIMIGRMEELDGTQRDSRFSDVTKGQKASGYIAEAQAAGYINGYPNGTFRPYAPITRGDMAIILSRVFPTPFSITADFTDVSPNMQAYEAISDILAANITIGYANHTFQPYTHVTRGQFAAFLARGLEPEFKNDARMAHSYMKDKTKSYTYNTGTHGLETHTFRYEDGPANEPIGYIWAREVPSIKETYLYGEVETRKQLILAHPIMDVFDPPILAYPIKVGTTYSLDNVHDVTHTITAVGVTVETPYRTFTNGVEVTVEFGYKEYFVEGFGKVKTVNKNGTIFELINVE
ncbi:S-layer homology domain-containing protein [Planococcus salinus]|uniref:S-layer homology domain-containing protein n=1 Tax=Planococcus salinus TaxID=1848460 RepID=UPI001314B702|nr:S-layer homology domain-containing protein [Planococcus salinus]